MCQEEIKGNRRAACSCTDGNILLSKDELLEMLRQHKGRLESELGLVNKKIKSAGMPGKEVRNMAETKKGVEKSETDKAAQEKSGCGCGCGCVPPVKK